MQLELVYNVLVEEVLSLTYTTEFCEVFHNVGQI